MGDINVLMVLDAFDIGGTETHVLSLAKELMKKGVNVYVAAHRGPLESKFRELPCGIFTFGRDTGFRKWIRRHKINLIHAHLESSGKIAAYVSNHLSIPLIYTIHGRYYNESKLRKLIRERSAPIAIVSVSWPIQEWLKRHGIESDLIPNGIDMDEFRKRNSDLRTKLGIPAEAKVLLYASRLEYEKYEICKRVLYLFEEKLRHEFRDMHLLIAGGGLKASRMKERVRLVNSSRVHFIGNRSDMTDVYSASDCVIGTGRVALEAISCKRPVIAVGTSGVFGLVKPDNLHEAIACYFCDHKSHRTLTEKNLASAVVRGLHDTENGWKWGNLLRQQLKPYARISAVASQFKQLYEKKLHERN